MFTPNLFHVTHRLPEGLSESETEIERGRGSERKISLEHVIQFQRLKNTRDSQIDVSQGRQQRLWRNEWPRRVPMKLYDSPWGTVCTHIR